ncbi:MAG: hypothetical protein HZB51_17510 [Chloroflexi bacterium]|nr:hypothetical protein [Chloroflexota bacterium]
MPVNHQACQFVRQLSPRPDKILIAIHGAGAFSPQDYEHFLQGVDDQIKDPAVKGKYDCLGVLYADLMPRHIALVGKEHSDFKKNFKQQILREQFLGLRAMERHRRTLPPGASTRTLGIKSAANDLLDWIFKNGIVDRLIDFLSLFVSLPPLANEIADEVYAYLNDFTFATQVQNCLLDALAQAAPYSQVVLVSHSLGTVVALDALNRWSSNQKIDYWFTLGCPLNKVKLLHEDSTATALTHYCVAHWYNLYDNHDIIAGVLGPNFSPQPNDPPTKPSVHDIFVEVGNAMPEAHDYMRNPLTLKFIADALQQRSVP